MIADKTKAALQSCQCHYGIFKQSQDITLIMAVNYKAKFLSLWVNVNLGEISYIRYQEFEPHYFLDAIKPFFYPSEAGQQDLWFRVVFITKFAVFNMHFIICRCEYPITDWVCIVTLIGSNNEGGNCNLHLVNSLLSGKAIFRHYSDTPPEVWLCLRWRNLISRFNAAVTNCPVLSPCSFKCSIQSATSCGTRAAIVCDLPLIAFVAMRMNSSQRVHQYGPNKKSVQHLTCSTPSHRLVLNTFGCIRCKYSEAPRVVATPTGLLTKPLYEVTVMAGSQHTQTHPEFTWRFLSTSERYPTAKPLVIYVNASSEQEARDTMPGVTLIFAARLPFHAFQVMEAAV
ncbi:TPA: host cell division inhibitor Icd-like protein [Klebsiella quasipneumoniae]